MSQFQRTQDYLGHILQAIDRINRHTADVDEVGFLSSELVQRDLPVLYRLIQRITDAPAK